MRNNVILIFVRFVLSQRLGGSKTGVFFFAAATLLFATTSAGTLSAQDDIPDKLEVMRELAQQRFRAGEYGKAVDAYQKVLAQDSRDPDAVRGIASSYERLQKPREAIGYLEPFVKSSGQKELGDEILLSRLYLAVGRGDEARTLTESFIVPASTEDGTLLDLSSLWLAVGRAPRALETLDRITGPERKSREAREVEADALAATGRHGSAATVYLELAGPDRSDLRFAWRYAEELALDSRIDQAYQEVRHLLPRGKPSIDQLVFGAQVCLDEKDIPLAAATVARIPASVRTEDVELIRAEVFIGAGKFRSAVPILERALWEYPRSLRVRRTFGRVLLELGRGKEGVVVFEPVLKSSYPSFADLKLGGQIYREAGLLSDARKTFRRLMKRKPRKIADAIDLAEFLIDEEFPDLAVEFLDSIPAGGRDGFAHRVAYGRALIALHRSDAIVLEKIGPLVKGQIPDRALGRRLGAVLLDLELNNMAMQVFERLPSSREPDLEGSLLRAKAIYRATGHRPRALEVLAPVLILIDEAENLVFDTAEFLLELRAPDLAIKVLDFKPAPEVKEAEFAVLRARIHYLGLGNWKKVHPDLERLVKFKTGHIITDLDLASLLLEVYEINLARTLLETMEVDGRYKFRHALLRAYVALRSNEGPGDAVLVLKALEKKLGADQSEWIQLAEAYLEVPDYDAALRILNVMRPPERLRFRHAVLTAQALTKKNAWAMVAHILKEIEVDLTSTPDKKQAALEMYLGLKEKAIVEELFRSLPDWWLETQDGRRTQVITSIAFNEGEAAVQVAETLVRDRPVDPNEQNLLAQSLVATKEFEQALQIYDELVKRVPHNEGWILGHAQALRGLERSRDALHPHLELVERYETKGLTPPIDFILEAAEVLDETKSHELSVDYYRRALALRPGDPDILKGLAGVLGRLDRHQEAIGLFKRAVETGTEPPKLDDHAALAGYLRQVGSREGARQEYMRVLDFNPDHLDALRGVAGILSERDDTRHRSLPVYRHILHLDPTDEETRAAYASNLAKLGEFVEADSFLDEIHTREPYNREARRVRTDLDVMHGHLNEAESHLMDLKYQDRTDPDAVIGLANISARRGPEYLKDEVHHVLEAKSVAPGRRAVQERMEQLFLPEVQPIYFVQNGSDTLLRQQAGVQMSRLLTDEWQANASVLERQISRRGIDVRGQDLDVDTLYNFAPGWSARFGAIIGRFGGDLDFLPRIESKFKNVYGSYVGGQLERHRIDDSPDALLAGLRSNTVQVYAGKDFRQFSAEARYRIDNVNDGNQRRSMSGQVNWNPWPRLNISFGLQTRVADDLPSAFDLYFAPLGYALAETGFLYTGKKRGPYEWKFGASGTLDQLDGLQGNGFRTRGNLSRSFGRLASLSLEAEYFTTSATRSLGSASKFEQTTFQFSYNARF